LNALPDKHYRKQKRTICEQCQFTGHPCQLDVHHKDGNRKNGGVENLQTLCANCHRLVSYAQRIALLRERLSPEAV
jgi:hypothetical protein